MQDGIWAGKSLLKDNEEFTTDPERYKDIDQMIASLHDENKWFLTDTRPAVLVRFVKTLIHSLAPYSLLLILTPYSLLLVKLLPT